MYDWFLVLMLRVVLVLWVCCWCYRFGFVSGDLASSV